MERRDFVSKAGCGLAGIMAAPMVFNSSDASAQGRGAKYKIEIEIFEAEGQRSCHTKGEMLKYPEDLGKLCPWLRSSMMDFLRLMENGVTLPWKYEGTPYEKEMDLDGVSTEFVRCPDPSVKYVAKIIRTKVG
jgi:uncharacterized repeat protein (TIGR04076 family)